MNRICVPAVTVLVFASIYPPWENAHDGVASVVWVVPEPEPEPEEGTVIVKLVVVGLPLVVSVAVKEVVDPADKYIVLV